MLSKNPEAIRKRSYRRKNRAIYNKAIKSWRTAHPGYWRKKRETQVEKQRGRCAICKRKLLFPYWDHDHNCPCNKGGQTYHRGCDKCHRGVLCSDCNTKLAALEKPGWVAKAKRYLKKWRARR